MQLRLAFECFFQWTLHVSFLPTNCYLFILNRIIPNKIFFLWFLCSFSLNELCDICKLFLVKMVKHQLLKPLIIINIHSYTLPGSSLYKITTADLHGWMQNVLIRICFQFKIFENASSQKQVNYDNYCYTVESGVRAKS